MIVTIQTRPAVTALTGLQATFQTSGQVETFHPKNASTGGGQAGPVVSRNPSGLDEEVKP
jgi:hypothetical protein